MKLGFVTVTLVITLLSQQVMAGVVTASMMGSMSIAEPSTSSMPHAHHEMVAHSNFDEASSSQAMECCQSDCAYCIAGCYSLLSSLLSEQLSAVALTPEPQEVPTPLVKSLDSLFRPPILA